jgi:hypothetical protein
VDSRPGIGGRRRSERHRSRDDPRPLGAEHDQGARRWVSESAPQRSRSLVWFAYAWTRTSSLGSMPSPGKRAPREAKCSDYAFGARA